MLAVGVYDCIHPPLPVYDGAAAAAVRQWLDILRPNIAVFSDAEGQLALCTGQRIQQIVVPVAEDGAVCRQITIHDALLRADALPAFEEFQMRMSDDGVKRHGGAHHFRQAFHIPRVGDAHLHHGAFMGLVQAEQRDGHAQVVVEVPRCLVDAKALGEHRRRHLLGGGLSDAPGDAQHRDVKLRAVKPGGGLQGGHRVRNEDHTRLHLIRDALRQRTGSAFFQRGGDKIMAVHPLAGDGGKEAAGGHGAAVRGHGGDLRPRRRRGADPLPAADAADVFDRKILHFRYFFMLTSMIFSQSAP